LEEVLVIFSSLQSSLHTDVLSINRDVGHRHASSAGARLALALPAGPRPPMINDKPHLILGGSGKDEPRPSTAPCAAKRFRFPRIEALRKEWRNSGRHSHIISKKIIRRRLVDGWVSEANAVQNEYRPFVHRLVADPRLSARGGHTWARAVWLLGTTREAEFPWNGCRGKSPISCSYLLSPVLFSRQSMRVRRSGP